MSAAESNRMPPPSNAERPRLSRGTKAIIVAVIVVVAGLSTYGVYVISQPATTTNCPTYTNSTGQVEVPNNASLIAAAKAEGTVKWLTTANDPNATQIARDFECDFPWANVVVDAVGTGADVEAALQGEFTGGVHTVDVASTGLSTIIVMNQSGWMGSFVNPVAVANYPSGAYDPAGLWTSLYQTPYGVAYFTDGGPGAPLSWANLTSSAYDNRLTMDEPWILGSSGTAFVGLWQYYVAQDPSTGNATWQALMDGIANTGPSFTTGIEEAISNVGLGADYAAVGAGYSDVFAAESAGLPVAFAWLNPTPVSPSVASIVADAPHNAMAELFVEWMASGHGQQAWASTGRASIIDGSLVPPAGVTLVAVTADSDPANQTAWENTLGNIFNPS